MDTFDRPSENKEKALTQAPAGEARKTQRQPRFIYLIFILIVFAGIFIAKFILDTLARKATTQSQVKPKAALPGPASTKAVKPLPEAEKPPDIPTTPALTQKKNPPPDFTLSGIFYDDKQPCALIDNKIVKEGDVISGAKVIQIMSNGVKLEFEGETFELTTK